MNKKNLQQIFANYIDRFEELNDEAHNETFKWWAAAEFRKQMDTAFQLDGKAFADALKPIRKVVEVIIDGKMQPFGGLVAIADINDEYADKVKQLFLNLFVNDGDDLAEREKKIANFLRGSEELQQKTKYAKYYSYKQTARSIAGYLFLYDPDHHYMYKATEAHRFADVVEFYGDWGSGNQIRLKEYYKMCDELVAEIENRPELKNTDKSRKAIENRYKPANLAEDKKHHILAYDIIYCNCTYDLDRNISFKKPSLQEKKLYDERMKKAQEKLKEYLQAEEKSQQLDEATRHYDSVLVPGTKVWHRVNGTGTIESRENEKIAVRFENGAVYKYDRFATIADQWLKFEDTLDEETAQRYRKLCKDYLSIGAALSRTRKALKEYEDILE